MPPSTIENGSVQLSPAERTILEQLGGEPWLADRLTAEAVKDARAELLRLRSAIGFADEGRWVTTSETNPKMAKNSVPTVGVTLLPATAALKVWRKRLSPTERQLIANVLGVSESEIRRRLKMTLCPRSTKGCRGGCVPFRSLNAQSGRTLESRLIKNLLHAFHPQHALALTASGLAKLHQNHGTRSRWRVNISDDVRWELIAPGLLDLGVPGYAYTKWSPEERPEIPGLSVVYSVTERTTDEAIVQLVTKRHRAAVVFDVPADGLPTEWNGIRVVDGNVTDDLYEHEPSVIVGLSAKGPTRAIKEEMRRSGFARAA